jgi:hypothetical protein
MCLILVLVLSAICRLRLICLYISCSGCWLFTARCLLLTAHGLPSYLCNRAPSLSCPSLHHTLCTALCGLTSALYSLSFKYCYGFFNFCHLFPFLCPLPSVLWAFVYLVTSILCLRFPLLARCPFTSADNLSTHPLISFSCNLYIYMSSTPCSLLSALCSPPFALSLSQVFVMFGNCSFTPTICPLPSAFCYRPQAYVFALQLLD